jgi:hypothetical protein
MRVPVMIRVTEANPVEKFQYEIESILTKLMKAKSR